MCNLATWIVFLPLAFGAVMLLFPNLKEGRSWKLGTVFAILQLAITLVAWFKFDEGAKGLQLGTNLDWFVELGSRFHLGFDGISIILALLVALVMVVIFVGARNFTWLEPSRERLFVGMMFFLQAGALGTFAAADLVLFYIFWELVLIPSYFLIGIFGGKDRIKAAVQFFMYTAIGSLLMLLAFSWLIFEHSRQFGAPSAAFSDLAHLKLSFDSSSLFAAMASPQGAVFCAIMLAFLVKSPLIPLHGWLLRTYREAPTAVTIFIAAVLGKMGTYGVIRFLGMFPEALSYWSVCLMWLAAIGILFGAFQAISSKDIKSLIAWSSLSHVSYILLGLFSGSIESASGAVLQMFNHGLIIAGLFLVTSYLEARRGSLHIDDFGDFANKTPILSIMFLLLMLGSIALPGTSSFVGEFLILAGAFKAHMLVGVLGALGMVFGAIYMLTFFQKTMFGKASSTSPVGDLSFEEISALCLVVWLVFQVGIYPQGFINKIKSSPSIQVVKEHQ